MSHELDIFEEKQDAGLCDNRNAVAEEVMQISKVLVHIQKLLNVRQGSIDMLSDYGLPDFNDLATRFPYAIIEIKNEIKACITKYEPRLVNVHVSHVQDEEEPLSLRFDITARLVTSERETSVWFETVLDSAGKVLVRKG